MIPGCDVIDAIKAKLATHQAKLAAGDISQASTVADLADLVVHASRYFGTRQDAASAALVGAAARQADADDLAAFVAKRQAKAAE